MAKHLNDLNNDKNDVFTVGYFYWAIVILYPFQNNRDEAEQSSKVEIFTFFFYSSILSVNKVTTNLPNLTVTF